METIVNVLRQVQYNKTKAAKLLNIDRKTLYNKMKAFNLLNNNTEADEDELVLYQLPLFFCYAFFM